MQTVPAETLEFAAAVVRVTIRGNVVFMRVEGEYSDEVALRMTHFLDGLMAQRRSGFIRVWDASGIPPNSFKLTLPCLRQLAAWAQTTRRQYPESVAYLIGSTPISYGMGRMYEVSAGLEETGVHVIHGFDELPLEVRQALAE